MSRTQRDPRKATSLRSRRPGWFGWTAGLLIAGLVVVVLYSVFATASAPKPGGAAGNSRLTYRVASPGIGQIAPDFTLADNTGGTVSLADYSGKNVLLFFQEGIACESCWTQIASFETDAARLKAAGIDAVVSITQDPAPLISRKVADMGLATPVLSDPDLATSNKYQANKYTMMGSSTDGHSFILVGPDGIIKWRADYGGAPDYTMYVPVKQLLLDLKADTKS